MADRLPSRQRTPRLRVALALGAALAIGTASTARGEASDPTITRNEMVYVFSESMTFSLDASWDTEVDDVLLRYTIGGDSPVNRRVPVYRPGTRVRATHTEDLLRGEIPPASTITWWWTLTDGRGHTRDTEPRASRYMDGRFGWRSVEGDGIRVWYYGGLKSTAHDVERIAQDVLGRVSAVIGSTPDAPIEVVVFASQDDLRSALPARGATYEARLATLGARVAPDILVLDAGTSAEDLAEVVAHELSHMVLNMHMERDYLDLPLWLDEGLAMYAEGPLDDDEQALLARAVADDTLMSVVSLTSFPGEAERVPLAYAQSRALVAFLIERDGEGTFRRFLDTLAEGEMSTDDALRTVYGFDQLGMYQSYREALDLAPAEPVDSTDTGRPRPPRRVGDGERSSVCASALLVAPALAAVWRRRRRAEAVGEGGRNAP